MNKKKWLSFICPFNFNDHYDIQKFFFLAFTFAGIIGAYAILHPLKSSLFLKLVGVKALPWARILTIFLIIPSMFLYTKLIDRLGRHATTCFFLLFYAALLICSMLFLYQNPWELGATQSPLNQAFGWIFYGILHFYSTFTAGTFWAYTNSMNNPESAQKQYGYIIAIGRTFGIISALGASIALDYIILPEHLIVSYIIASTSGMLIISYFCLVLLKQKLPKSYLQGYVDAHQHKKLVHPTSTLDGISMLINNSYVRGIFGLICSFELIYIILDYQLQLLVFLETQDSMTAMSKIFLHNTAMVQGLTLFFALFGTAPLLRLIGVKNCLVLVPIIIFSCIVTFLCHQTLGTLIIITIVIHALNYGFNAPVRQIALIPTTDEIQFKARAWMDSCGKTASKFSASTLGLLIQNNSPHLSLLLNSWASLIIAAGWMGIATFIGNKYEKTIQEDKLIGK